MSGTAAAGYQPSSGDPRARALTPRRVLAMLVLPAALLPVTLLGPGELNAPRRLARQAWAAAVRFERSLRPARGRPRPAPRHAAEISFGNLYGNWHGFPQEGREGLVRPGPTR